MEKIYVILTCFICVANTLFGQIDKKMSQVKLKKLQSIFIMRR